MRRADKTILSGDEQLFRKAEWISPDDLFGENTVLRSPLINSAFRLIIKKHTPRHKIAFLSVCTATRPYSLSKKWKKYIEEFGDKADLIVVSGGGIIPEQYWGSYPFLNYDAPEPRNMSKSVLDKFGSGALEDDDLWKWTLYERLLKFFKAHQYDYVLANFSHKTRARQPATKSLMNLKIEGFIKDFILLPHVSTYNEAKSQGWNQNGKMFPDLHPVIFKELKLHIEKAHMSK